MPARPESSFFFSTSRTGLSTEDSETEDEGTGEDTVAVDEAGDDAGVDDAAVDGGSNAGELPPVESDPPEELLGGCSLSGSCTDSGLWSLFSGFDPISLTFIRQN